MEWNAVINERVGLVSGALLLVYAFMKGHIVPGWLYRHSLQRQERLEAALEDTMGLSREAVDTAHMIARRQERSVDDESA